MKKNIIISNIEYLIESREGGTKSAFAKKIGRTAGNIGDWLSGKSNPKSPAIDKICKAYGISYDDLTKTSLRTGEKIQELQGNNDAYTTVDGSGMSPDIPKPNNEIKITLSTDEYLKLRDGLVREHERAKIFESQIVGYFKDLKENLVDLKDTLKKDKMQQENNMKDSNEGTTKRLGQLGHVPRRTVQRN